jgi:hypothetical protein
MPKRVVKIEKVAENRVVAEYEDGSKAVFDLMRILDGPKVWLVTLIDRRGNIIGPFIIPWHSYADQ